MNQEGNSQYFCSAVVVELNLEQGPILDLQLVWMKIIWIWIYQGD
jgi:hypothetical protein